MLRDLLPKLNTALLSFTIALLIGWIQVRGSRNQRRYMSRTLFSYIFRDLLKIFLLTSGVLAGIMSFAGVLRPLTEHGLDAGQAAGMLEDLLPAVRTYSVPLAGLFAPTA